MSNLLVNLAKALDRSGRLRDLEDVLSILRKHNVDVDYIYRWLEAFEQTLRQPLVQRFEQIRHEEAQNGP